MNWQRSTTRFEHELEARQARPQTAWWTSSKYASLQSFSELASPPLCFSAPAVFLPTVPAAPPSFSSSKSQSYSYFTSYRRDRREVPSNVDELARKKTPGCPSATNRWSAVSTPAEFRLVGYKRCFTAASLPCGPHECPVLGCQDVPAPASQGATTRRHGVHQVAEILICARRSTWPLT